MKRSAERQLTKDGGDDNDIEEIQDPQGFQRADEPTLAKRQIRALPKRALVGSRPPSLNGLSPAPGPDVGNPEAAQPKFGGFSGFGAGTSASNSFTFTAQPSTASTPSPSVFDTVSGPTQPTPNSASPSLGAPKSISPGFDALHPKPVPPSAEETDAVAFKYFKSLRGLNVSFLSAMSAAVEKDPFIDVANLVESYKSLRTTIQTEFDGSSQASTVRDPVTTSSGSIFGPKAPPEKTIPLFSTLKPSIEASPESFVTNESGTGTGSFTYPPFIPPSSSAPTQLPFALSKPSEPFTSSSTTTPEPSKPAFTFAASNTSASMSNQPFTTGLSFAASMNNTTFKSVSGSSIQESEGSSTGSLPRPNSTTPGLSSSDVPNLFAANKSSSLFGNTDGAFKPTSVFSSSVFGNSTTSSSKPTPFNASSSNSEDSAKVITTLFGNATSTSSSTSANIFWSSSDSPVSSFGSSFQTSAFASGKPGGSIGNPVGFGFGGSSSSAGDTVTPGSSSSGFTFGPSSTKFSERLFTPPMTDKSSESTPQPEAEGNEKGGEEEEAAKLLPSHTHDEEGEGEEDEETTYVVRCKVYRLFKSEDKNEWKDLGIGMFRLKKHKETNVRRVLMRNSNTGRILINFRIHQSLKPTLTKTAISFVGYENNTPTSFSVRVKTEEQAKDLKQALEQEIVAIQAAE